MGISHQCLSRFPYLDIVCELADVRCRRLRTTLISWITDQTITEPSVDLNLLYLNTTRDWSPILSARRPRASSMPDIKIDEFHFDIRCTPSIEYIATLHILHPPGTLQAPSMFVEHDDLYNHRTRVRGNCERKLAIDTMTSLCM
jgi:hypothetical protein